VTDSAFGGSAELFLFHGNWELRIAYDGWALAQDMKIAYPVRGTCCFYTPAQWTTPCLHCSR